MKLINISIFLLAITSCYAQSSEEYAKEELASLHSRTVFVRDSISTLIKATNLKIDAETDAVKKERLLLTVDSLWNISDRNDIEELKINIDYSKKNPACALSFQLVNAKMISQPGKNFYNDFEYIYNNAAKELKESERGKIMAERLIYFKQSMVGSKAPQLSGTDINNEKLSLIDFHSEKYVLLDFWASWCAPCLQEIPFLNSLHEKYRKNGFEIISISTDKDLTKWKNTVMKKKIDNWKHFSTVQNDSSAEKDYFVYGIPHKVLIDKNGQIIGKWKASGELNKREIESKLLQIFGF